MANWANVNCCIVGDYKQLRKLATVLEELAAMPDPGRIPNDFGSKWLGNLVDKLGADWNTVGCRGWWEDVHFDEDGLMFKYESAWHELNDVHKLIEEKFPGVAVYYVCEEPGCGHYVTNDDYGIYFPERYVFEYEDGIHPICDLTTLVAEVESVTGKKCLGTYEACKKAAESYSKETGEHCYVDSYAVVN